MKTFRFVALFFVFGTLVSQSANAQIIDSLPWFKAPGITDFMNKYMLVLGDGNTIALSNSIQQPKPSAGWDEGVAAAKIAKQGQKQLKALKLNRSASSWSYKEIPSKTRGTRRVAIFIPTNQTNPKLVTSKNVMTHPYYFKPFGNRNVKQGVVFEVEVNISAELGAGAKVVINHEEQY